MPPKLASSPHGAGQLCKGDITFVSSKSQYWGLCGNSSSHGLREYNSVYKNRRGPAKNNGPSLWPLRTSPDCPEQCPLLLRDLIYCHGSRSHLKTLRRTHGIQKDHCNPTASSELLPIPGPDFHSLAKNKEEKLASVVTFIPLVTLPGLCVTGTSSVSLRGRTLHKRPTARLLFPTPHTRLIFLTEAQLPRTHSEDWFTTLNAAGGTLSFLGCQPGSGTGRIHKSQPGQTCQSASMQAKQLPSGLLPRWGPGPLAAHKLAHFKETGVYSAKQVTK